MFRPETNDYRASCMTPEENAVGTSQFYIGGHGWYQESWFDVEDIL